VTKQRNRLLPDVVFLVFAADLPVVGHIVCSVSLSICPMTEKKKFTHAKNRRVGIALVALHAV